jgi:7,8-dihydroneopterin aldolase/epimerase/oxygenase
MPDRWPAPPAEARSWPDTYAILVADFHAPVADRTGQPAEARLDVRLIVAHPGPDFADDIGAVMSYEPIVKTLRRLCANSGPTDAERLAQDAARQLGTFPTVRWIGVQARLSCAPDIGTAAVFI